MFYSQSLAWKFLLFVGFTVAIVGIYFIFFRAPLLPEDIRFLQIEGRSELSQIMAPWLKYVFTVLGGYIFATGGLMINLAVGDFRELKVRALVVSFVAGSTSIGLMTWVNFQLHSDFRWHLLTLALLWGLAVLLGIFESRQQKI